MAHIEMFPAQLRDLQLEIRQHPTLVHDLTQINDLGEWFARVATSANVLVDGMYAIKDLPGLCELLTRRLYESRTSLIVLHSSGKGKIV